MIRILFYLVVVLALGFGFSWLAERPGDLFIIWQGQRIEMSLMVAATMVVILVALVMFAWWLVRTVWTSPHRSRSAPAEATSMSLRPFTAARKSPSAMGLRQIFPVQTKRTFFKGRASGSAK